MTDPVMKSGSFARAHRRARVSILATLLMASGLVGAPSAVRAADEVTARDVSDVRPSREGLERELKQLRQNYNGNIEDYRNSAKAIKDKYKTLDANRGKYFEGIEKRYGGQIENTGRNPPKDVRADGDFKANTDEAANKLAQEWRGANHDVVDYPHKIVNKTTDTTLWKPCTTPECQAVKVRDPDAWTSSGGLQSTGNKDQFRDPIGQYLDNEKKFIHAREDFGHATANPNAIDQAKVFESVKTASKSLHKVGETSGIRNPDDPFWKQISNIREDYFDPYEAGIADPRDPPAKQVQDIDDFLARAEQEMLKAKGDLNARGAVTDYVREQMQEELRKAKPADPDAAAMNQEGADAIQSKRDRVADSNKPVEDFNREQGRIGEKPGTPSPRKDLGTIREEARARRERERAAAGDQSGPPVAGGDGTIYEPERSGGATPTDPSPPPVAGGEPAVPGSGTRPGESAPKVAGTEPDVPRAGQDATAERVAPPERSATPGAEPPNPTVRERVRTGAGRVAKGVAEGAMTGAAVTYMTCMASPGMTHEECLAAAGQSIFDPLGIGLEALAATGPLGEALVAIYGAHHAGRAIGQAILEASKIPDAMRNEAEAVNVLTSQLVGTQQEISQARADCRYQDALDIARRAEARFSGLGLRPDGGVVQAAPGTTNVIAFAPWLPAMMPELERTAQAQRGVDILLAKAATTSDPKLKSQLLTAAQNIASGVPCLVNKVREAQNKLLPASEEPSCIYVINASGGSIWIGTEKQQKTTRARDIKGAGIGKEPPQVMKEVACYPTRKIATDAWCRELQGKKIEHWILAHNDRVEVYGGKYWIGSAPGCPSAVARRYQDPSPAQSPSEPQAATQHPERKESPRPEGEAHTPEKSGKESDQAAATPDRCAGEREKMAAANTLIAAEKFDDAERALSAVNVTACPAIATDIARDRSRIATTISSSVKAADEARRTCNATRLAEVAGRLREIQNGRLTELAAGLDQMAGAVNLAEASLSVARNASGAGNFQAANRQLEWARGQIEPYAKQGRCKNTAGEIAAELERARKTATAVDKANEAIAACDIGKMTSFRDEFKKAGTGYQLLVVGRLEPAINQIALVRGRLDEARSALAGGKLDAARSGIALAKTSLRDLPARCPPLGQGIDNVSSEIDRIGQTIQSAETAINRCDKAGLDESRSALGRISNPATKSMLTRLISGAEECTVRERVKAATEKAKEAIAACDIGKITSYRNEFAKAGASYQLLVVEPLQTALDRFARVRDPLTKARTLLQGGKLDDARSGVARARTALRDLPNRCPPLGEDIDKIADEIGRIQDTIQIAETAIRSCDKTKLDESKTTLARISNPAAKLVSARLNTEAVECAKREREKAVAAANDTCRRIYGGFSVPVAESIGREVKCICDKGYQWSDNGKSCERIVTKEEIAQQNNARCRQDHGDNTYAGKPAKDGSFHCFCTRGYDWNSEGKRCISDREVAEERHQSCRSQFGEASISTGLNRDGTSNCNCRSGYNWDADEKCAPVAQIVAAANSNCQDSFGSDAIAVKLVDGSKFQCSCRQGYDFAKVSGKDVCQRQPSQEEVLAEGDEVCEREFGQGSQALRQNRNGTFQCTIPGRQAAPPRRQRPRGPSAADIARATAVIGGIAAAVAAAKRSRGPVAQPQSRCHRGPDGRIHCGGR